jgi:hypothetical protein
MSDSKVCRERERERERKRSNDEVVKVSWVQWSRARGANWALARCQSPQELSGGSVVGSWGGCRSGVYS